MVTYLHNFETGRIAMTITTLTSRQFNQDASKAKKAAKTGPVFITDRGRTAHVLLSFDEYKKISGSHAKIADLLAMPGIAEMDIEIPSWNDLTQAADLS